MTIELAAGDLRLVLDPVTGGAVAAFTYRGIELLRPVADVRLGAQHGRAVAAYPLIPFANRVANGRFAFGGERFQLGRNFGDSPHTIHGNAWMHPWTVAESGPRDARLTLDFKPDERTAAEWPFAYAADQGFELSHDALRMTLSVRNTDTRPWPAGIGWHPYVARTPEATLRLEADTVWVSGADGLPATRVAVGGRWEFDAGKLLGAEEIDNCFAGWGGIAVLALPEAGLIVSISAPPPIDHLQLYTPAGCDYLGLEPVSNMPDAINRMEDVEDQGLVVLEPGASLTAYLEIGVRVSSD
jgi:aldose 1-epimerase